MKIYAESSAVLRWLLGQPDGAEVRRVIASADIVFSSALTMVECRRAVFRLLATKEITPRNADRLLESLARELGTWHIIPWSDSVFERAAGRFPSEPVRSLDAIHLASAMVANDSGNVVMLSWDHRVRKNAQLLGLAILPAEQL